MDITDSKTFWKAVKPFLSDKVTSTQKIALIGNDKIIENDDDTARVLNTFLSNTMSDLNIPDYNDCDALAENIQEPILKAIVKYRNHPKKTQFCLRCVDKEEILKETLNLGASNACQVSDIHPIKNY